MVCRLDRAHAQLPAADADPRGIPVLLRGIVDGLPQHIEAFLFGDRKGHLRGTVAGDREHHATDGGGKEPADVGILMDIARHESAAMCLDVQRRAPLGGDIGRWIDPMRRFRVMR